MFSVKEKGLSAQVILDIISGMILDTGSANERRRYIITPSLTGWAHT